jgi:predicted membrane-bound spermidine synthase
MAKREIKQVDPFSLAKVLGILYALLGVIIGLMVAAFGAILSNSPLAEADETAQTILSTFLGVGSIIFFPIFYGILGLVAGVITAALYNLVARWVGGVMIEVGE